MAHLSLLKKGILLSRSDALLDLCDVRHFYFDKTGTLEAVESRFEAREGEAFDVAYLKELVTKCRHPILRGLGGGEDKNLLSNVQESAGEGVEATAADGSLLLVGSASYLRRRGVPLTDFFDRDFPGVAFGGVLKGQLMLKKIYDLKSHHVLRELSTLRPQARLVILSGDPAREAGRVFLKKNKSVLYRGGLSPEDKERLIEPRSAFVGDGLNDTLALAKADVSFRVGDRITGFAPVDFQLQTPNLDLLLLAVKYAKAYRRILWQTAGAAFLYNGLALTLAVLGLFSPLGAAASMLLSFLILLFSILRLLRPGVL
jgi:Cu2+-exporting ATPase